MYEAIIETRKRQTEWAEQAAKHALKLSQDDLDLICYDNEYSSFREAMAGPHRAMIILAAMDILAEGIITCLISADTPTDPVASIQLFPELSISAHYFYGDAMLDAHVEVGMPKLDAAFESHFQYFEGKTTLFMALAYILRESPPSSWGQLEFERRPDANFLRATLKPFNKT
jgi:hypothetical protein